MDLSCETVSYAAAGKLILDRVSLKVDGNQFHAILGPNGCGKTSLLKTIYRVIKPDSGKIYLDRKQLSAVRLRDTAQKMAVVTQFNPLPFDCTAAEAVMLGRTPHLSFMQRTGEADRALVRDALRKVGLEGKEDQPCRFLSGGEKQRVVLARALAQEPSLLLLDEPINHLDIKYQLELLQLVKDLGINVLAVLHDVQLASRYADYLYLMKGGRIVYEGRPQRAITAKSLQAVYDVSCQVSWTTDGQALIHYH